MITLWTRGLIRRRPGRLLAAAAGIAVAVALLASLGAFLTHSSATMTQRAVRGVGVDWQVQVGAGTDPATVRAAAAAAPEATGTAVVSQGTSGALTATTGGTTQTTGAAVVLGIPADYRTLFPAELRTLAGSDNGVLLAQQTAANLHAAPGDTVSITVAGGPPAPVVISGIVDLPLADSLFQKVGAAPGSQPTAAPDNVLLLPNDVWHRIFDPLTATGPDLASTQIHVRLAHSLPPDPASAYTAVAAAAKNFEAATAGTAVVGNNLGAALDAARADAAYAQILFGFLGIPGAVLAALLTSTVTSAGATRRRTEQALLRARGASAAQQTRLAAVEAGVTGTIGVLIGLTAAAVTGQLAFGTASFGPTTATAVTWGAASGAAGLLIAFATILWPARRQLRRHTVTAGRAPISRHTSPAWARFGLDGALLLGAGLIWTASSAGGYQLVLAPEGAPTIAVSYWALAGPALLWGGAGLLTWRIVDLALGRGLPVLRTLLTPFTRSLTIPIAATLSRQRRPIARGAVLLGLAIAFAVSTATFNATYAQQAEADAQLTNGADVTVTAAPGSPPAPDLTNRLSAIPGVVSVEPLQHRFAYIGNDLQDLYGIHPSTITTATALQDSYFSGGTASDLLNTLNSRPDSILVSAETVKDYQLTVGDLINLRLTDSRTGQLATVPFHYTGVVTEFPTAPKDSFFVANADYIGQQTGDPTAGTFLVNTGGVGPAEVAGQARAVVGATATVIDITSTRRTIGSSLTSVDLSGLTRVELSFALVLAVGAGGLVLGLGLAERRRAFAIATALGADRRQLRKMVSSEAVVLAVGGLIAGGALGALLSGMLIKILTGVFDPPPSTVAVPWAYVGSVAAVSIAGLAVVVIAVTSRVNRRPAVAALREL